MPDDPRNPRNPRPPWEDGAPSEVTEQDEPLADDHEPLRSWDPDEGDR